MSTKLLGYNEHFCTLNDAKLSVTIGVADDLIQLIFLCQLVANIFVS